MKSLAASVLLAISAQALQLEYEMGDPEDLSVEGQAFDPQKMTHYSGITGRGDTQEGTDTRKNVLEYDEQGLTEDEKARPMCHVGGIDSKPDEEGPSPECCRVYEYSGYVGRQFDFCLYDVAQKTLPYQKYWQADTYGWHNEINSYWCGSDVGIRLCVHPNDASATDDKEAKGECRGGNPNVVEDVGKKPQVPDPVNEASDSVWIFKNPCKEYGCAAVYEYPQCEGVSWLAYPQIRQVMGVQNVPAYGTGYTEFEGSWDYYNGTRHNFNSNPAMNSVGNLQLHWGSSESVKLDPRVEFETFFTNESTGVGTENAQYYDEVFERENAFTHRNFEDNDNQPFVVDETPKQCHNYLAIWRYQDLPMYIHADMYDDNGIEKDPPMGVGAGFSNVFGIKIREQFFPGFEPE